MPKDNHIGFLDLVRGFLAFWVYYAHLKMASIGKDVIWGSPALAVDGFMLLSGFLMAYHWVLREDRFQNFWQQAKDFYIRRFFRIAPLYYSLLTVVFIWQNKFISIKEAVNAIIPPAWGGAVLVMDRPDFQPLSFWNLISHYSFTFGFIPKFVNSNMLPDWSIGLEMQFYLIFPILVLIIARFGSAATTFLVFLSTIATAKFIGLYDHAGLIARFPQPSFILFKLNFFLSGMAIAYAYLAKENKRKTYWILISLLSLFNAKIHILMIAALIILLLFFDENSSDIFSRIGNGKFSKFLGDTSYGLYLMHLPVMYPILYILFKQVWFSKMPIYPRLVVTMAIISPLVYGLAYLMNRSIELPGIRLGKQIASRIRPEKQAADKI